ncbi:MAG TPA: efflux RND transporter periplasmic adaptor subunit [Armatimonadota bacterium]|nr:efflux RND transporter periplasmic adaptor subunit [Armatimonadota bacterium]
MKRYALFAVVILVIGGFAAKTVISRIFKQRAVSQEAPGISVRVAYARMGAMASVVEVSGDIKALNSTALSAKIPGRVVEVPYREGDRVSAGAMVVRQDTSDLGDQARQSDAALRAAESRLSQAETSATLSDTQTKAQVAQATAALDAAKARLQMIKKGARSQELATAENAVASAKANFENAKINLERMRDLYAQGALSKQQMDLVQMQYDVASAQYDTAKQQLSLVKAGAREEEIEAAQKQADQAEEALRIAEANREQNALREEDIKSAKAGVAQAEAVLAYARQQLANAQIRTPIAGTVSKRFTEPGQMASPGVALIEIVDLDSIYFEATVSEIDIGRIKIGQPVKITADALAGQRFKGSVKKILPTADPESRHFTVWIKVLNRTGDLRPYMFARGGIEVARHEDAVIIPKDALVSSGKSQAVFVVVGSQAKLRPVATGFETHEEAEAMSGVSADDILVVVGQDKLTDGVKVNVAD